MLGNSKDRGKWIRILFVQCFFRYSRHVTAKMRSRDTKYINIRLYVAKTDGEMALRSHYILFSQWIWIFPFTEHPTEKNINLYVNEIRLRKIKLDSKINPYDSRATWLSKLPFSYENLFCNVYKVVSLLYFSKDENQTQ